MPRTRGRIDLGLSRPRSGRSPDLRIARPTATLVSDVGKPMEIVEEEGDASTPARVSLALRTLVRLMARAHAADCLASARTLDFRAPSDPDHGDEAA